MYIFLWEGKDRQLREQLGVKGLVQRPYSEISLATMGFELTPRQIAGTVSYPLPWFHIHTISQSSNNIYRPQIIPIWFVTVPWEFSPNRFPTQCPVPHRMGSILTFLIILTRLALYCISDYRWQLLVCMKFEFAKVLLNSQIFLICFKINISRYQVRVEVRGRSSQIRRRSQEAEREPTLLAGP